MASVLNGLSLVCTRYRTEWPSGEMNILAAFLKSSRCSTWAGMLNPAIDGCAASCFSDNRNAADSLSPAPICLTWSTSWSTASATCRLPPANRSAPLCSWFRFACRPPGWSIPMVCSTLVSFVECITQAVRRRFEGFLSG